MAEKPTTWIQMLFKGKPVYIRCDANGEAVFDEGMVEIRYQKGPGKIYRGSPRNLETASASGEIVTMEEPTIDNSLPPQGITGPRTPDITIYTDGACSGNPGPAGYGVVIMQGDTRREISGWIGEGTNNIAELEAIHAAMDNIPEKELTIDLYTDSSYSIGVLTKGWKAKANQELIATMRNKVSTFQNLQFYWVKGHVGIPENERADELARLAISTRKTQFIE